MASVRTRFAFACAFGAAVAVGIATAGLLVETKLGGNLENIATTATALRNHTVGDMLHDALRADVYAAFYAAQYGEDASEVEDELAEHTKEFQERIAANAELPLSSEARMALDALGKPLREYMTMAEYIGRTAGKNPEKAKAQMPVFIERFMALEKAMDHAGDIIEASAQQAEQEAVATRTLAKVVGGLGIVSALLAAAAMMVIVRGGVLLPLADIEQVMKRLSTGEPVRIPHGERQDELGTMARAISVFQLTMERQAQAEQRTISERANAAEQRRVITDGMLRQIGELAQAASRGDFTARIDPDKGDRALAEVAGKLNTLVETVEKGLKGTVNTLAVLSTGNLTVRVAGDDQGDFAALRDGVNRMADRLADALANLTSSASAVKTAATEMGAGMEDLARRTTEQAHTVTSTSNALSDFTGRIRENATQAADATRAVRDAERQAQEGSTVLVAARDAMNRISTSSTRISDIVELIDGIAFQTNLLALNAAVEAARAGEVGRGFAVVASEVRTLAQRAAEASHEIKGLISQAQTEIASGVSLVAETSVNLESIFSAIGNVTQVMGHIARSANEQADDVMDLYAAVERLGDTAQQNASLVEETTAAIGVTEQEAERLEELAKGFTLVPQGRAPMRRFA